MSTRKHGKFLSKSTANEKRANLEDWSRKTSLEAVAPTQELRGEGGS
jgi:hypothetical protein